MADRDRNVRVLVVDDEPMVVDVVQRYLLREGYEVDTAREGKTALRLARERSPDIIVLDLMLPGVDGLEVCRTLRSESAVPVIILSAKGEESDKILGLGLGADDYLTKPFSPGELVARVKAVLRRASSSRAAYVATDAVLLADLRINPKTRIIEVAGQRVDLTAREFDLLYFLASHAGQVFTREQLMDHVWGYQFAGDASTVTVHVRRLREKIEADPERPRYIKTVWGVGYKFEAA